MIEFRTGDLLRADAEALVNAVNCVGIMGRGIAPQFKSHFPENFEAYEAACKREDDLRQSAPFAKATQACHRRKVFGAP
jgi:O-acetyl-ADP-ribose deacetylase (regulator of RNase III)